MFFGGETVEEIAAGRIGVIVGNGVVGRPLEKWTVQFRDGETPLIKDFTDPNELRLIERPGDGEPPRLIPKDPVV